MLDAQQLYHNQPDLVKLQLPNRLRNQLLSGVDALILDEQEFHPPRGEPQGRELVRISATDFAVAGEDYTCRIELRAKAELVYDQNGFVDDGQGNKLGCQLYPFYEADGSRSERTHLPTMGNEQSSVWLPGFKSPPLPLAMFQELGYCDESTLRYLYEKAQQWVKAEADGVDPYYAKREDGSNAINDFNALLQTDYVDFTLTVNQSQFDSRIVRYGINDIHFEEGGLRQLPGNRGRAGVRQTRMAKPGAPQSATPKPPQQAPQPQPQPQPQAQPQQAPQPGIPAFNQPTNGNGGDF